MKELVKEYDFKTDDILQYDDEQVNYFEAVKKLPKPDYIILILYAHFQSQRKVGSLLGVTHSIIGRELRRIRNEITNIIRNDLS